MKTPRLLLCSQLAAALAASGWAQTTSAQPSAPADTTEENVLVLSPFVVNSERDTGYAATSTLAGTRLNTQVKDIGASISIYTKDFLADLGVTNANELLVYATGMDAAGAQGNFSGARTDGGSLSLTDTQAVGEGPRISPQSGTRTRGLAAPEYTRGFFMSDIPMDAYITAAVTVNRGPNAMLFGIGSPAGVVDTTLIAPDLYRDRNKFENRVGDNGSMRNTLDLNRVLIKDKLALRLAALEDREEYDQRPAFEHKTRLFGTATFQPYRSTALRANFETGKTRANRPITVLPYNSISSYWYAAGRPTFDWTFYDDPARNPDAATQAAQNFRPATINQAQVFSAIIVPYASTTAATPGTSFISNVNGTGGTGFNQVRNGILHPTMNRDGAGDNTFFYETTNIGETALPSSVFPGGVRPAGIKLQGFTNYDVFPFNKRMLDETSRQTEKFNTHTVSLEQGAWKDPRGQDRVGVELAYYSQFFERQARNTFMSQSNSNHIRIDPNVTLPDGRPNPNVGRPYMAGLAGSSWNYNETEREVLRATAFLRYDFKDVSDTLGFWLGRHTVTGLGEQNTVDSVTYDTRLTVAGVVADFLNPTNNASFARRPYGIVYLGDSILGGAPLKLNPIRIPAFASGFTTPTSYFSAPNGSTAQGSVTTATTSLEEIVNNGTAIRERIKSQAFVLQSYWLADHAITTLGWRRDEDYYSRRGFGYPNYPYQNRFHIGEFGFPDSPPFNVAGEVKSYSVVLRWPQRLLRLPAGTDATVFYNKSSNFTPAGGRFTALNQRLSSPKGNTEEFGFGLAMFDDKLNLRFNTFETSVTGQSYSPGFDGAYRQAVSQIAGFWAGERNINPSIDRTAEIERLWSPVPEYKQLYNWALITTPAGLYSFSGQDPSGMTDTTDYVAKGHELEVVYNPGNWRFLLNVSKQETKQSNNGPTARAFVERMKPVWAELANRPRGNYPAGHVLGNPLPPGTETLGSWVQTNVLVPYATMLATEGIVSPEQRKWRVNLVANYTFDRDSVLKGFGVGGGVRWQDKYALGYPTRFNPDNSIFVDVKNPYWGEDDLNVDLWVSYGRKIFRDKIDWKVQLNARNVIGDRDPIAITVQPDGSAAATRLPPEQRIYLTNTFSF